MKPIAIIPARGGSKRIPRKNIKDFFGRPIIAYSIQAAQKSDLFDMVVVTTEDEEIREVVQSLGVEHILDRPARLANDFSTTYDVVIDALDQLELEEVSVCCIYATAPMLTVADLIQAKLFVDGEDWQYVFAATRYRYPVQRSFVRSETGSVKMLDSSFYQARSQDLPPVFHDVGWFYWASAETWRNSPVVFSSSSTFIEIPQNRAVDIDTEEDWQFAELLYERLETQRAK